MPGSMRIARFVAFALILLWADLAATTGAGSTQPTAPPIATPTGAPAAARDAVSDAERQLAERYAPIVMLREQPEPCSPIGERYVPIAVDITLNDPQVTLRRRRQAGEAHDPVITTAPSAQDLAGLDASHYLDLPGHALMPGCEYETWSRQRIDDLGLSPAVYARVATEPARPDKLALQYWFYYAFDNYNNSHESDWEMVQLTFDAGTAEDALAMDPSMLSYAQHSGGENAAWEEDTVELRDGRIVTYPAEGSHADYYSDAVWLAWGESGSGFGCDQAQEPLVEIDPEVIVIPGDVDPEGPFAWALFEGRWGEHHPWQFDAPYSPNVSRRWTAPISWTDDLRSASYPVPHTPAFGIAPSEFFCSLTTMGGGLAKRVQVAPQLVTAAVVLVVVGLLLSTILTWRFLVRAIRLHTAHWWLFLPASAALLVVAAFTAWLRTFLQHTVLGDWIDGDIDIEGAIATTLDTGGVGFLLQVMLASVVAPGVIALTTRLVEGGAPPSWRAIVEALHASPTVAGALLLNHAIVLALSVTVVLLPLAIFRQVQWAYTPHAVMLDEATVWTSRTVSRQSIEGDWLRTLGMAVLVTIMAGVPGPVIGIALIVVGGMPLAAAGYISSLIFALIYPTTVIASTLYYLQRRQRNAARAARGEASRDWVEAISGRLRGAAG
jgi:hypothetical protein